MHQLLIDLANYVGKAWANEWLKKSNGGTPGPNRESAGEEDLNADGNKRKSSELLASPHSTSEGPVTPRGEDVHP
jgi:hypothetical protein